MSIILNIAIVALAGLIAYWWANQGVFSALLHFLCVVAAGGIALALWEPVTVGFLLRGGWFDDYAWGVSLLGIFAVALFVLRLTCDKLVPDNLNMPSWVNYTFGTLFGVGAGILTVGMMILGCGFLQSSVDIMGYRGVVRDSQFAGRPGKTGTLYPPVHEWTAGFYTMLSAGALDPTFTRASLSRNYPDLGAMAVSLYRDGFADGEGKTSLAPNSASVDGIVYTPDVKLDAKGAYGVTVTFQQSGYDRGEMLIMSAAQVRLIGVDSSGKAVAVHPVRWAQLTKSGPVEFAFDDVTHFATSIAGQQTTTIIFMFPATDFAGGGKPEFIQLKGLRFRLPDIAGKSVSAVEWVTARSKLGGTTVKVAFDPNAPFIEDREIFADNSISPLTISTNAMAGMEVVENYLASGKGEFPKSFDNSVSKGLRVKGLLEADGIKIVKVNVSRGKSTIDIWDDKHDFRKRAGSGAAPMLVDSEGRTYKPYGYFWIKPDKVEINLSPAKGIQTVGEIPSLPSSGTHELFLLYKVAEGAHLVGFRLGDITVANCDLTIGEKADSGTKGSLSIGG